MSALKDVQLHLVETLADANEFMRWMNKGNTPDGMVAFDTETSGLDKKRDHVRLAQFGNRIQGWAIDFSKWSGLVEQAINEWSGRWAMHNAKFDVAMMANHGITFDLSRVDDTRFMAHILNPSESSALKAQCSIHIDRAAALAQKALDDVMHSSGYTWATVPVTDSGPLAMYWQYGALDPVLTYRLWEKHWPRVQREAPKAYDLELAVAWVVAGMESRGVKIDREFTESTDESLLNMVHQIRETCIHDYGVSPGAAQSIAEVLVSDGIDLTEKTEQGNWKLDKHVLNRFAGKHALVDLVARHRKAVKLQSTYTRRFIEYSEYDGRIRPNINTIGGSGKSEGESGGAYAVRTSRMSMDSPNLQQLPRGGDDLADTIRNCVVPSDDDHVFVFFDFDQVELRVMAHLSQDAGLIAAFNDPKKDFFVELAKQIYNDPSFTKGDPRRPAVKSTVYGVLYGAQPPKIAQTAGISLAEATELYNGLMCAYPGLAVFMRKIQETGRRNFEREGVPYVRSPLTGRKYVADSEHKLYTLVNYLIQGMGAEILKMKLLELDAAELGPYMRLPIHDEIMMEVPRDQVSNVIVTAGEVMNDYDLLSVPLTSGAAIGERWGEKKDADWREHYELCNYRS